MSEPRKTYLPAAGRDWMLPLYDPLVKLMGAEATRLALVEQASLHPSHRVLEIGCGTGGLLMVAARRHPGITLVGLDPKRVRQDAILFGRVGIHYYDASAPAA